MEQNTLEITEQPEVFAFTSIRELVNQTLYHSDLSDEEGLNGVSTGFRTLDKVTGGFQKGQLTTIAVRPGMGKTAFLLSMANNLAIKNNYAIAIFSSERSSRKMTSRLIESETGMSVAKLQHGKLKASERDHMESLVSSIAKASIFLDDTPALTTEELYKKCRQLKLQHQVDLVIIDYLELLSTISANGHNRMEQLNAVVKALKDIAGELHLPIVLFSQLQGSYQGLAQNARPSLKDLPVFLSELSDMVMILHRSDLNPQNSHLSDRVMVEMILAKHPDHGKEDIVPLAFIESIAKFSDQS